MGSEGITEIRIIRVWKGRLVLGSRTDKRGELKGKMQTGFGVVSFFFPPCKYLLVDNHQSVGPAETDAASTMLMGYDTYKHVQHGL